MTTMIRMRVVVVVVVAVFISGKHYRGNAAIGRFAVVDAVLFLYNHLFRRSVPTSTSFSLSSHLFFIIVILLLFFAFLGVHFVFVFLLF